MKCLRALESRSQRTYDRDFESIKNPRYPEPDDDEEVKTAPGQPIEAERNIGVNDGGRFLHLGASKVCRGLRCLPRAEGSSRRGNADEVNGFRRHGDGGRGLMLNVLIEGRVSDRSPPARRRRRTGNAAGAKPAFVLAHRKAALHAKRLSEERRCRV
jgi:hypothetical protein